MKVSVATYQTLQLLAISNIFKSSFKLSLYCYRLYKYEFLVGKCNLAIILNLLGKGHDFIQQNTPGISVILKYAYLL